MKLLVGTPIYPNKKYCWSRYIISAKRFGAVMVIDTSKDGEMEHLIKELRFIYKHVWKERALDRVIIARNLIIEYAQKYNYDYVLFLDADIILPAGTLSWVNHQMEEGIKIISGLYMGFQNMDPTKALAAARIKIGEKYKSIPLEWYDGKIHNVDLVGIGCLLIHHSLFDIKFRCERDKKGKILKWEDQCYCEDVINNGNSIFLDTGLNCKHCIKGNHWKDFKKI